MADLKNNINPTIDNAENINSDIVQNNELNTDLGGTDQLEQLEQPPVYEASQIDTINESQPEPTPAETPNNEIILGKFDNAMINTAPEQGTDSQPDVSSSEQPTTQKTPTNEETSTENQPKSKLAQKEKLLQLIKVHESKAKTKGFATGILSGVVLSVGIFALSYVFAKDQIINLLNGEKENSSLSANVVELNINTLENEDSESNENVLSENDEKIDDENIYDYEDINKDFENVNKDSEKTENVLSENEEDIDNKDIYDYEDYEEELDEKIYEKVDEKIDEDLEDINKNSEKSTYIEDLNEDSEKTENVLSENDEKIDNQNNENIKDEETTTKKDIEANEKENNNISNNSSKEETAKYNITHVSSTGEANWVLPTHCSDLTCYGEDKEFIPCTTFKLAENLDENSNRIGNNGTCRYKDSSELVYVKFN